MLDLILKTRLGNNLSLPRRSSLSLSLSLSLSTQKVDPFLPFTLIRVPR